MASGVGEVHLDCATATVPFLTRDPIITSSRLVLPSPASISVFTPAIAVSRVGSPVP